VKPTINQTEFGSITIEGHTFRHDVVIELDGRVRKRKKKLSKRQFGTSHRISVDEIKDLFQTGAQQLIIGTGQYDQVRLSDEASAFLVDKDCQVTLLPTPTALEHWNETRQTGACIGLFHVTC
jgi:hypothetical protein